MEQNSNSYDIIIVGGGHAGIEAAYMAAKFKKKAALITLNKNAIGRMSCNPAIGGLAKGQMVRELDVLGGLMARVADIAGIQFKVLNRSKGKSVWSPRAQVDKHHYEKIITTTIFNSLWITIIEAEVIDFIDKNGSVRGVVLRNGIKLYTNAIILTCGTFLNGRIHIGEQKINAGRMGENRSQGITEALVSRGLRAGRLKTGTPPRLIGNSINWSKTDIVWGDPKPVPFSYHTNPFNPPNTPCHTIRTNIECKEIIQENIFRSPMFSGDVAGIGPRYCPSIEDKVYRFSHRDSHTLFLEPEWVNSDQIYANGFSTSLPEVIQLKALRTVRGLEKVQFYRPGYAIEYDFFNPSQLKSSLESKAISGLYFAGQINGTSGYEEAAIQGLLAGLNAVLRLNEENPFVLKRDEAYAGVLIDDLITKDTWEPYRMFTSRAEYRLLLRFSNAHERLSKKAIKYGLLSESDYDFLDSLILHTKDIIKALKNSLKPDEINSILISKGDRPIKHQKPACELLKRPSISITDFPDRLFQGINNSPKNTVFKQELFLEAETQIKYQGYIRRQKEQVDRIKKQDLVYLPSDFNYANVNSLSLEAREKLQAIKPETLGQAMRVSGVSPADVAVLSVLIADK
ncbi:MAG: tRNA uridine-5-carboxymethylaminomethyl(34) synthesis enzyme MnmG [Fidelibacterota bacterium]